MSFSKEEAHKLMADIQVNHKKRILCSKHNFGKYPNSRVQNSTLICFNCGAWMSIIDIIHYADGYAAAGGNPNDVIQGFYNDKEPWR